jgi:AraC-like DNA-binding protein
MGFRFERAYHQRGFAPRGFLSFGIPLNGSLDWNRQQVDVPRILSFNGDSGFDGVSPDGFRGLTLSVAQSWLQATSASFGMPVSEQLVDSRAGYVLAPSTASSELTARLRRLLASGAGHFDSHQESELALQLIVAALGDSGCDDKSTFNQRARAIDLAINFIEDHRGDAIRVSEICRETGVPWRTLDRAFRERFGMGPKAYLMRRRLGGVREALATGPNDLRIADVANAWGFWHMGQFARDYKRLFGELPSETLRHSCAHP